MSTCDQLDLQTLKVERPSISTNQIARNLEFGLSTLRTMAKFQRLSQFKMINFLKKATDSQRKFGSDGNGNPNYGQEAVGFFH
jgi:hypothetical protein